MTDDPAGPSLWARRLGFGGVIPFVGLAAALWLARPGDWPLASLALLGYGATIASFLGAIHPKNVSYPVAARPISIGAGGPTPTIRSQM